MIKSIFESKYIKLTIVIVLILIVAICFLGQSRGGEIVINEAKLTVVDESGDYQLVKENDVYTVRTIEGEVVYEPVSDDAMLVAREGYIVDQVPSGKMGVIDFLSGKVIFVPDDDDRIETGKTGLWVMEKSIEEKDSIFVETVYYILDENFEIALDGTLFDMVEYTDEYLYGGVLVGDNYNDMQKAIKKGKYTPSAKKEYCVVNNKGEIVYKTSKYIHNMKDDSIVITEEGDYIFLNIYTGEKEAAGYEYR